MSWHRAHGTIQCLGVGCATAISAGEVYYRTRSGLDYCEPCGRRLFLETPPEALESVPVKKLALPPSLTRFTKESAAKELRGRILDWRKRQAGEAT